MASSIDDTLPADTLHRTLEPRRATPDSAGQRALSDLARVSEMPGLALGQGLVIDEVIGYGGMGVVHAATQMAVGRKVAVKMLRPDQRNHASAMRLLREAWVTGRVEHPSVVPVYEVAVDADRQPLIVLRRIDGSEWESLIDEPDLVRQRFGAGDALAWNLRVLIQVCNAVHFAHQRGILHRDLKPENVMVGELGEVYVLDWGIAVSLIDDGSGRLPLARDATQAAGTPCYMAPELWAGAPERLSARTDVYLLGGILFRILAGRAPHQGSTLAEMCASAEEGPRLPPAAPEVLADICRRAMAPALDDRPPSALELRRELEAYLERRSAELLADEAERGLERLRAALAGRAPDRKIAYGLFGACRFGFEQAVSRAADEPRSARGLVTAVATMIDYEIAADDAKSAAALLASLPSAPAELAERVAAAQRAHDERAAERDKLEALGRQHDDRVGRRTRLFFAIVFGTIWTLTPLVSWLVQRGGPPLTYPQLISYSTVILALLVGFGTWARESMTKTQLNRAVLGVATFIPVAQILLAVGDRALGLPASLALQQMLLLWSALATVTGLAFERRLLFSGAVFGAGWLVAAYVPSLTRPMMAVGNLALTIVLLLAWRPRARSWSEELTQR
ncbi:MAG: Serine/threonine protein kinase PrkC, regulator of stationary phase [Myxococcales bacterium]|nr:Serine/threonine protein kinase PrkC, regulator of stationary phase [Myxococcales bacterium]